ncbi:Hypothetical predicted protein [Prunus dulcis]|uniref:Uncharacterized protein n=1 Tax=Prunus dulcis TaxID=3755 RepID=A0A5E4FMV6_PRUDU|nr:Hypothetical predicted protein [Prunus dulcis]
MAVTPAVEIRFAEVIDFSKDGDCNVGLLPRRKGLLERREARVMRGCRSLAREESRAIFLGFFSLPRLGVTVVQCVTSDCVDLVPVFLSVLEWLFPLRVVWFFLASRWWCRLVLFVFEAMKSSGAFGFEATVVRSVISSFAIWVHYTLIVTTFSGSFTCFWVWIGSSLGIPEAAFVMITLDATSSFRWPATTAPPDQV